jgi:hypothetical protein
MCASQVIATVRRTRSDGTDLMKLLLASLLAGVSLASTEPFSVPPPPPGTSTPVPGVAGLSHADDVFARDSLIHGVLVREEAFTFPGSAAATEPFVTWKAGHILALVEARGVHRYTHGGRPFAYLVWLVAKEPTGAVSGGMWILLLTDSNGDGLFDTVSQPTNVGGLDDRWDPPIPNWLSGSPE